MSARSKYYFVSDVHLGVDGADKTALERSFVEFLTRAKQDAAAVYLLGDIFDFWYEYRYVIPRGHTRALGALADLCDSGVEVVFIPGNHDVWAYSYFSEEIGMKVITEPAVVEIAGKNCCIGHGDSLGKTDAGFRFIRWMFHNRFLQILFSSIHPRWAMGLGYAWASHSRKMKNRPDSPRYVFSGEDEVLYRFSDSFGKHYASVAGKRIDYYIFGHYHTPGRIAVASGGELVLLGCWVDNGEFAVFDGRALSLYGRK